MFEPIGFSEQSSEQTQLMASLQRRDIVTFEKLLAHPNVDPDHWYGKPYWATCLGLACKERGCEAFVLALLRSGAGTAKRLVPPPTQQDVQIESSGTSNGPQQKDQAFLVDPAVLKATVDLALSKDKQIAMLDQVLQTTRETYQIVQECKSDIQSCLTQIEDIKLQIVDIEKEQRHTNSRLAYIMEETTTSSSLNKEC